MKELTKTAGLPVDLASAFDASPNPYMLLTPDFRYAGMNSAYLRVTNSSRDQLLGRNIFDIFDSGATEEGRENARQLRASFQRVLDEDKPDHLALIRYSIPLPGPDGRVAMQERFWSATHTPIHDDDGRIAYILQHTSDITELENLRRRVEHADDRDAVVALLGGGVLDRAQSVQEDNRRLQTERNRLLDMFMQAPGFVAVLVGPNHVFEMHNAAYAQLIGHREIAGKRLADALPEVEGQGFVALLDEVRRTGVPFEGRAAPVQLQRARDAPLETVYLDFIYQPIRDDEGDVAGIFVQGHDVTDTVVSAQRQKLMIDELNHRVKNTLATVQSIAMQTARSAPDPAAFAATFQARLMALSHTHNLLTQSHWEGASLADILRHETEAHGAHRVLPNGPTVALEPAAALSLGMIIHELATNAAKYGALSTEGGRVLVDWTLSPDRDLTLSWREVGGPEPVAPDRKGFGSRLIERNVRHDLAGSVEIRYPPEGFVADFTIPLSTKAAA